MWHHYFKNLLNSSSDFKYREFVLQRFKHCDSSVFNVTASEIREAVKLLKKGKSAGLDNLTGEHLIYVCDKLFILLSMCINSMINHGYLPQIFMDTILVPIVKNVKGDITDGDNYRPIAITCIASKVVELVILDKFSALFDTTHNQFGFKKGSSTELCIFSLKSTIERYTSLGSPVYIRYLDASKAFDSWALFRKLINLNFPILCVRFFM